MKRNILIILILLVTLSSGYFYVREFQKSKTIIDLISAKKNIDGFLIKSPSNTEYLIINYWASWCPPCIEETPSLIRFVNANSDKYKLIAISQDSSSKDIENFLKTFPSLRNPNTEILWDDNKELARKMAVEKLPETFIYSIPLNKFLKISGSTNWEDPELKNYIAKYFNP